jgi:hypothetical protein
LLPDDGISVDIIIPLSKVGNLLFHFFLSLFNIKFPYPLENLLKKVIYGLVDKIDVIIIHSLGKAGSSGDHPIKAFL